MQGQDYPGKGTIPSLGMDEAELVPRWERVSEVGCVTGGCWSLGKEVQATKGRVKNQERNVKVSKSHEGSGLKDVPVSLMFANGRTATQICCHGHAVRIRLHSQLGAQDVSSWVLSLSSEGTNRHRQIC